MRTRKNEDFSEIRKIVGESYEIIDSIDFSHRAPLNEGAAELFDEEISASVYQIGDFTVRIAKCAYVEYPYLWDERKPVTAERLQELREQFRSMQRKKDSSVCFRSGFSFGCSSDRIETVVSARQHTDKSNYQYICHAQEEWYGWCENISWIGAVRIQGDNPQTVLLVYKAWCGDSHSSDYWYLFGANGAVKEYQFREEAKD